MTGYVEHVGDFCLLLCISDHDWLYRNTWVSSVCYCVFQIMTGYIVHVGDLCLLLCISDHDWLYRTRG